jgi:hypothetical protein
VYAKFQNPTTCPSVVLGMTVPTPTTRSEKITKIVAYGCQTPSAQRRSDQCITYNIFNIPITIVPMVNFLRFVFCLSFLAGLVVAYILKKSN